MNCRLFYSLNDYYRETFGCKAYKITLNAGMTCPNRDGTLGKRGCIFCSAGGSGDFAPSAGLSLSQQIEESIRNISRKYNGSCFIGYFQAFTNTYAPTSTLRNIFTEVITDSRISGIAIATRPDCLEQDKIEMLSELNRIKPVTVELGLQTSNELTAAYIRRGYSLDVYDNVCTALNEAEIPFVTHMIVGLPGENAKDYLNTAGHIVQSGAHGIKIQLLHILKGTDLADEYNKGLFEALTPEEYVQAVADIIEILPPNMVIHRLTGDGPKDLLIAPLWSRNKKYVLNSITKELIKRNTYQGKEYRQWL